MLRRFWLIRAMQYVLVAAGLLGAPGRAAETWHTALPDAQPLGSGAMTWYGLEIYQATLWAARQPFDASQPFALQLTYNMSIGRARLVHTSLDEIRRLSPSRLDADTLERWESVLDGVMVDVTKGDQLIGVYLPGRGMRLYDARKLLGEVDDPALAQAFFDIWLNPATRDKSLRRRLLAQ